MCNLILSSPSILSFLQNFSIAFSFSLLLILVPMAYLVVGRHFDRATEGGGKVGPDYWFGLLGAVLLRPISYSYAVVFDSEWYRVRAKESDLFQHVLERVNYRGLRFKESAGPWRVVFCYAYVASILFFIIVIVPLVGVCEIL